MRRKWIHVVALVGLVAGGCKDPSGHSVSEEAAAPASPTSSTPVAAPAPQRCDGREGARARWFNAPHSEFRTEPMKDLGFQMLGTCNEKILDRDIACDEQSVRSSKNDSPYLIRAAALGFTI